MSDKPLIAVCYDRVSTTRQAEQGVMLQARSEKLPLYCQLQGYDYSDDRYFTDPGLSGWKSVVRPGFERAMRMACQPGYILVVDSLSRFVRSNIEADKALKRLQSAGGDIAIIGLGIDTTTAAGKLIYRFMAAAAEFESEQTSERMKATHDYMRKKYGRTLMSVVPYGYQRIDGVLVPDEEELEVMRSARRIYQRLEHHRHRRVTTVAMLNEMGVPTVATIRNRRKNPPDVDVPWTVHILGEVLLDRLMCFERRRKGKKKTTAA